MFVCTSVSFERRCLRTRDQRMANIKNVENHTNHCNLQITHVHTQQFNECRNEGIIQNSTGRWRPTLYNNISNPILPYETIASDFTKPQFLCYIVIWYYLAMAYEKSKLFICRNTNGTSSQIQQFLSQVGKNTPNETGAIKKYSVKVTAFHVMPSYSNSC